MSEMKDEIANPSTQAGLAVRHNSAMSTSVATTVEADLDLPEDCFLLPKQNDGFQIPYFLSSKEEVNKIRPPPVVKTWEQRYAELSESQQKAHASFKEMVAGAPWYEENKFDDWLCLRYLIARNYDLKKSFVMLENTVKWWKETGSETWRCDACFENPSQHMAQFVGWDKEHRPVVFMSMRWGPERKNPLRHMVVCFNHLIRMMPVGVGKWVCLTDFQTYSHLHDGKPSMGISVIRTIQDHFPERLGKMICINPPKLFSFLWNLFLPAIDPVTRSKVEFVYTDDKPAACEEFQRLFPQHLCDYLCDTYDRSKYNLPAKPLVWHPRPDGYPKTFEERKPRVQQLKELEKQNKSNAKAARKAKKGEIEERESSTAASPTSSNAETSK
ncbi:hypothetical protein ABL78_7981 [Leptomonas seymouri]|uniref:CRAL-TRIO domain-containing protein n=1 Tax=Leptomonas seymouri TaxID=5684 RepID=A0A0N1IHG0_LEPSE|nr:hypothetical protein ABL78_7981 [Leptomonas seymouri]|eukprot:KPI83000.1 hypothetical protein ABL78_7981 [Leptomonas seymouri]